MMRLKRVCEEPSRGDGLRILVDLGPGPSGRQLNFRLTDLLHRAISRGPRL
jgi:hypothetical protein